MKNFKRTFKRCISIGFLIICVSGIIFPIKTVYAASNPTGIMNKISDILDGVANDIIVEDSIAYIACGKGGLKIYNVSDPNNPLFINELDEIGDIWGIDLQDVYVYLVGTQGLLIIDISNPEDLHIIGSYNKPQEKLHLEVQVEGDVAFIADYFQGLLIINISDVQNPERISKFWDFCYYRDLYVRDPYVYLIDEYDFGIDIVNVSDLLHPSKVGSFRDTGSFSEDIFVNGDICYVADSSEELEIVNISDPVHPVRVGTYNQPILTVFATNTHAFISTIYGAFKILDITNPSSPVQISSLNQESGQEIWLSDSIVYLTQNWLEGISIIDVSTPSSPSLISSIDEESYIFDITCIDESVYLAGSDALFKINSSNPITPTITEKYGTPYNSYSSVGHSADLLYAIRSSTLEVIDSVNMTDLGSYTYSKEVTKLVAYPNQILLLGYFGFAIVDISFKINPVLLCEFEFNDPQLQVMDGEIIDDLVIITCMNWDDESGYMKIFDVSNPSTVTEISELRIDYPENVCVDGYTVFIVTSQDGLKFIDLSNPWSPSIIGGYNCPVLVSVSNYFTDICVQNNYMYASIFEGILLLDIHDLADPKLLFHLEDEFPQKIYVEEDILYYSSGDDGLEIASVTITEPGKIPGFSPFYITIVLIAFILILVTREKNRRIPS